MGAAVGTLDGPLVVGAAVVGDSVGFAEGAKVGTWVGCAVGTELGLAVGTKDGLFVGANDGATDGNAVGIVRHLPFPVPALNCPWGQK